MLAAAPSDIHKIVRMIMERHYDPVIIFSFRCHLSAAMLSSAQ